MRSFDSGVKRIAVSVEHLLKTTALPIATIAARSGFKSVQYFNHCFSARHHLPPGEWRKQK